MEKLGKLFEIKKGIKVEQLETYQNGALRYISTEDLDSDNNFKYCIFDNKKYIEAEKDDIIIAWNGSVGKLRYCIDGIIGSILARLRCKEEFKKNINTKYIGYFLEGERKNLENTATGATIKHINRKVLEGIKIPLPPFEIQKKIADTLDKATQLIDKRKEQIEKMDEFLKSLFLDMFGDPVSNPMGWDNLKFDDIGTLQRGKSKHRPRNAPELLGGKYPLIQTGEVANSGIFIKEYSQTYSEIGFKQSKLWKKGTLCITIAANIAKTGILKFDACFPDSIVGFLPNNKSNSLYIQFWLIFLQQTLESNAPGSAQKNINLRILNELEIPIPPIDLQNKFAEIVEKTEAEKEKLQQSLTQLENNFNSIMQKAFKGELF